MTNKLLSPTIRVSGPPGTGKTTYLLGVVEKLLNDGVPPDQIIFTTFSKAGASEAVARASRKFGLPREKFRWFRTLHSLCYKFSSRRKVMSQKDLFHIGKQTGVKFTAASGSDDGTFYGKSKGDVMLTMIHMARVSRRPLTEVWRDTSRGIVTLFEVEHLARAINNFKTETGKIDYTDMLEEFVSSRPRIEAQALIMDESQDSSALQWDVVRHLSSLVKQTWCAGDDDQCIHEWNGASAAHFIALACDESVVLNQSYRVPRCVHQNAMDLVQRIKTRIPKRYLPRDEEGEIIRCAHLQHLDLRGNGTWLILARNVFMLPECAELAQRQGTLYHYDRDMSNLGEAIEAVSAWERLRAGQMVTRDEAVKAYAFMASGVEVERGGKTALENADADELVEMTDLQLSFGLRSCEPWDKQLSKLTDDQIRYFQRVAENEPLSAKPRIRISTIHGAKGMEADNVVLITDLSRTCMNNWINSKDEEIRVLYVALTRTRRRLFVMNPRGYCHYGI